MATKKRITLHPIGSNGLPDLNTNLYPKTLNTAIVDADGETFEPQEKLTAGTGIDITNNVISSAQTGATNLENGTGFNSLKQKGAIYTELNAYIRPYVVAYLISQGMTQQQAEATADANISTPGSTKYILAGFGITGNLVNNAYGLNSYIFGTNNRTGVQMPTTAEDISKGMLCGIFGQELVNEGINSCLFGKGFDFKCQGRTGDDLVNARAYLVLLQNNGFVSTGKTEQQIFNGDADTFVVHLGTMKGTNSIGFNNCIVEGTNNFSLNCFVKGENNFATGNQSVVTGENNFSSGWQNQNKGKASATFGSSNLVNTNVRNSLVSGQGLQCYSDNQTVIGQWNYNVDTNAFEVGCGTGTNNLGNAFSVKKAGGFDSFGESTVYGNLKVSSMGSDNLSVTTKQYVDSNFANKGSTNTFTAVQTFNNDIKVNYIKDLGGTNRFVTSTTGTIYCNAHLLPYSSSSIYSLGNSTYKWKDLYLSGSLSDGTASNSITVAELVALKARGRFLSVWDCELGLPGTNPSVMPYTYVTGDYYIVSYVGSTNHRPNGTTYSGSPSTTVESGTVAVNDTYYFDGTSWTLLHTLTPTVSFSSLVGSPSDNSALNNALNSKASLSAANTFTEPNTFGVINANSTIKSGDDSTFEILSNDENSSISFNNGNIFLSPNGTVESETSFTAPIYYINNFNFSQLDSSQWILRKTDTNTTLAFGGTTSTYFNTNVFPNGSTKSLGGSSNLWKDLYLSGVLSDGTSSASVSQIANGTFNVINASDIVNNTLTQAQADLVTNGKPTLILGTLLGYYYPILSSFKIDGTAYFGTISGMKNSRVFETSGIIFFITTKVLTLGFTTLSINNGTSLNNLSSINSKSFPAYSRGQLTYDGTNLKWVDNGIVSDTSSTTFSGALSSAKTYSFATALTSINISSLDTQTGDNNPYWELHFIAGTGLTVTLPSGTTWVDGTPTFESGNEYRIIVKKGITSGTYKAHLIEE